MGKKKRAEAEAPPVKVNLSAEARRIGITRGAMGQRVRTWMERGLSREAARVAACKGTPTQPPGTPRPTPRSFGDAAAKARAAGFDPTTIYRRLGSGAAQTVEEAIAMGRGKPGPRPGTPRPARPGTETWDPVAQ